MRILIIEDDAELAAAVADYLGLQQAICDFAYNGLAGLKLAREQSFDAIILDLMLPKMDGFEVCQQLRQNGIHTPVLMLTAFDTNPDQLKGFSVGADDYVTKPCSMPLLWARLQALYRRNQVMSDQLSVADLTIFLKQHRVCRDEKEIKLTPTGWSMLELLMRESPKVVTREEIQTHIWPDDDVSTNNFNVQLHQLRKAVDKPFNRPLIQTISGVGFCIRVEANVEKK